MKYRLLSPAAEELTKAVHYYEEASLGLGLEFLDEFERTVRRILLNPLAWTKVSARHHRCRMHRFPYGLIYSVQEEEILVSAVFHLHRHPDSWKARDS